MDKETLLKKLEAIADKFDVMEGYEDGDEYDCGDMNSAIERSYHEVADEIRDLIKEARVSK